MFGLSKAEKARREAEDKERRMAERKEWIGRVMVAAQTIKTSRSSHPASPGAYITDVVEARQASGFVTDVGERTVCIDGEWYETNPYAVGGLRVIEVIDVKAPPLRLVA